MKEPQDESIVGLASVNIPLDANGAPHGVWDFRTENSTYRVDFDKREWTRPQHRAESSFPHKGGFVVQMEPPGIGRSLRLVYVLEKPSKSAPMVGYALQTGPIMFIQRYGADSAAAKVDALLTK